MTIPLTECCVRLWRYRPAIDPEFAMTIRALVFDFDGLICDTETSSFETARAIYLEHGVELTVAQWQDRIGTHGRPWYADLEAVDRTAVRSGGVDGAAPPRASRTGAGRGGDAGCGGIRRRRIRGRARAGGGVELVRSVG